MSGDMDPLVPEGCLFAPPTRALGVSTKVICLFVRFKKNSGIQTGFTDSKRVGPRCTILMILDLGGGDNPTSGNTTEHQQLRLYQATSRQQLVQPARGVHSMPRTMNPSMLVPDHPKTIL